MPEKTAGPTSDHVVLDNGWELLIRPVQPDDKRRLAQAFERLRPKTRYRRFFAPLERLSAQDLRYLTEVDHHDHEALAAVNPENGMIVGVARYVRSDDPTEAEVAVVVGDPWHGHGVATALLQRLVARAREEGIDHFVALVMSDNTEALELFRHLAPGGSHTRRSASGHTELVMALPDPERIGESLWAGRCGRRPVDCGSIHGRSCGSGSADAASLPRPWPAAVSRSTTGPA